MKNRNKQKKKIQYNKNVMSFNVSVGTLNTQPEESIGLKAVQRYAV